MSNKIVIGKFGQTFGIHGWIKVHSFTSPTSNLLNFKPWFLYNKKEARWQEIALEQGKINGKNIVVKLPNCDNPETVRLYTNLEIAIEKEQLPALTDGEFYQSDLEGLKVINTKNIELGTVTYVLETSANDVLMLKSDKQERAIPYLKNTILKVDLDRKEIIVDWDETF